MADFVPIDIASARKFLEANHCAVLAARKKDGTIQMTPVTAGLDAEGRAIISSRESAYKVRNLRRDPATSLCVFTSAFHGGGWVQINGCAEVTSLPVALETLMYLQRQVYGEHHDWSAFHKRMERERRVIIRIAIESVGPGRRG
ncbi:MAG TPA: TIGR03618 family F420-dependent PPOX class oxidoreductase [Candidatus Binatia bacterium]|jgi:PPOX class probable F420-dependent enzyme